MERTGRHDEGRVREIGLKRTGGQYMGKAVLWRFRAAVLLKVPFLVPEVKLSEPVEEISDGRS